VKISESSRIRVWISITLMVSLYIGAVYWVYRASSGTSYRTARIVPLATSLAVVPLVLVVVLAIISTIAKSIRYLARVRAASISPEIRETLASVIVGEGDRARLRWLAHHHSRPFEIIFSEFLSTFGGKINFELASALLNSGLPEAPGLVFKMLPDQSLLGRILLADSLRPFATELCERHIPNGIRLTDKRAAKASVELLRAWERWIPIPDFSRLVSERDIDLRVAALPALRFVTETEQEAAQEVVDLLEFPDERVRAPAAKAAADIGISASIPLLINQMRKDGPVSALAAAQALARLGPNGRDLLESEILSSSRPNYALQALEQSLVAERG